MKNIYILLLLALAGLGITACEENEDFFDVEKAPSIITFEGFPGFSGTFATTDDIVIPVTATNAGEIVVERVLSYTADDEPRTINEVLTTLSGPEATLETTWDAILATPEEVGLEAISDVSLDFNVTVDGEETFKTFDLEFTNPLTLGFTEEIDGEDVERAAPETSFRDSTFLVYYNVNSSQTPIERVEFFAKVNESGTFSDTPLQTVEVGGTDLDEQTATFTFPGEDVISADSVYAIQIIATAVNGNTATEVVEIEATEIPFTEEGEFALRPASYELEEGVTDTLSQAFDFSELAVLSSTDIASNPEAVDLVATANDDVLSEGLNLEAVGSTDFVVASESFGFDAATYESTRDAFLAGTVVTTLEDVSSLPSDQVVIVRVGDVADTSPKQYAVMRVADVVRGFDINQSEATIAYRAR